MPKLEHTKRSNKYETEPTLSKTKITKCVYCKSKAINDTLCDGCRTAYNCLVRKSINRINTFWEEWNRS